MDLDVGEELELEGLKRSYHLLYEIGILGMSGRVWRRSICLGESAAKRGLALGGEGAARWRYRAGTRWRAAGARCAPSRRGQSW